MYVFNRFFEITIFIDAIKPDGDKCRVCGGELSARSDDQDEEAIDQRHGIYYDADTGTLFVSTYAATNASRGRETRWRVSQLPEAASVQVFCGDSLYPDWKVLDALKQLDLVPLQVLVEASIIEIAPAIPSPRSCETC